MSAHFDIRPLFPTLDYGRAGRVDLELLAQQYLAGRQESAANPLLDPATMSACVAALHAERSFAWSYGGYFENRATLLRRTYLDETAGYLHVGIDCNVPAGTPLAAPLPGTVIDLFDDPGEPQGWGPRIIVATDDERAPFIVFGHLGPHRARRGQKLQPGEIFGEIAPPPLNGNWFPHLHLQVLSREAAERFQENDFMTLDGYGHPRDRAALARDFPDPTWLIEASI